LRWRATEGSTKGSKRTQKASSTVARAGGNILSKKESKELVSKKDVRGTQHVDKKSLSHKTKWPKRRTGIDRTVRTITVFLTTKAAKKTHPRSNHEDGEIISGPPEKKIWSVTAKKWKHAPGEAGSRKGRQSWEWETQGIGVVKKGKTNNHVQCTRKGYISQIPHPRIKKRAR